MNTTYNTQNYKCYWCNKMISISFDALPKNKNGTLDFCFKNNDFNHYMYYQLDENKKVYMKCLKCDKINYI